MYGENNSELMLQYYISEQLKCRVHSTINEKNFTKKGEERIVGSEQQKVYQNTRLKSVSANIE